MTGDALPPLREVDSVRQHDGEDRRRWFTNGEMDLYVWFGSDARRPSAFQFCYSLGREQRSVTWKAPDRLVHEGIDTGEANPARNSTPISTAAGDVEPATLVDVFERVGGDVPANLHAFVVDRLRQGEQSVAAVAASRAGWFDAFGRRLRGLFGRGDG